MDLLVNDAPPLARTPLQDEIASDLAALLQEFVNAGNPPTPALIARIATASMGPQHLWEDLGLGSRDELNALMQQYFPRLKALNSGNMRWKKFLYRLLCERADMLICKSPHCEQCEDRPLCFPS